jgi:GT2 family glycosyltransferase
MGTRWVELSIIIVTWNAKKFVRECLESLQFYWQDSNAEIIVVDNASSDGTPALVRQEFPHVRLLENTSNLGFAKANNIGMCVSRGKYVCLINSDVNVPLKCIERMIEYMDRNPPVGLLGPRMLRPDGLVGRSYMRFPSIWRGVCNALALHSIFKGSKSFGGILMTDFDNDQTAEVDVLNGWFVMTRRQALEQVGMLDERFFIYGEDIDWSYRFHKAGWKRVYFSGAQALHYGAASSAAAPVRFYIEMQRANIQLYRKHYGRVPALWYGIIRGLHEIIRLIGYSILFVAKKSVRSSSVFKLKRSFACICWLAKCGRGQDRVTTL